MTRALLLLAARAVATAHLFTVTACRPDAVPSGTVHTDSAGVAIATAITPRWGPSEGWTVAEAPLLEIGTVTGAPEYQFADVVAAVRLSNGDIVVADRGASELRGYDPEGTFQWRAGGAGEGPGEFQSLDFLGSMAGDSLVTHDRSLQRVQLFDPAGRLARTLRVTLPRGEAASNGSGPDKAIGVVDGRLIIRFIEVADETPTGIVRWLNERVAALDLGDGAANALMVVAGEEVEMHPRDGGGYSQGRFAFGNMPEFGAAAERVAVIDTEAYTVRIFSPRDGTIERIIRRDVAPREVTDALFEAHLDGIARIAFADPESAPPEQLSGLKQMWRGFPRAPTVPVLRSVHMDVQGNLWVAPFYLAGAEPPPFEVFAPDGTWLGSVALPPGLDRGFIQYQAPYMEIGADYVLGVWNDELDVPYVRMYRLQK